MTPAKSDENLQFSRKKPAPYPSITIQGSNYPVSVSYEYAWSNAMKKNCVLMPGALRNRSVQNELSDRGFVADQENAHTLGNRARRETECFINSNLHDPTTGWPMLSRRPSRAVA